jgi:multisubunit Na+/H+ antiporter MnhB subunit
MTIKREVVSLIALCIISVFLIFSVIPSMMRPFGEPPSDMDDYIIEHAQNETGSNNAVTSVVFDYRGFDTLGEATILFTAVAGIILLFRRLKHD